MQQIMQCPTCQANVPPGASFCVNCGSALATTQPGQPLATGQPTGMPVPQPVMTPVQPYAQPYAQPYVATTPTAPPASTYPPGYASPLSQPLPQSVSQYPMQAPMQYPMQPGMSATGTPPQVYYAPPGMPMPAPTQPMGAASPLSSPLMLSVFGPATSPAPPSTPLQQTIARSVSPGLAANMWFTSIGGAIAAIIAGLILTFGALVIWSKTLSDLFSAASGNAIGAVLSSVAKTLLTPNLLTLFAISHHVPLDFSFNVSASGVSGNSGVSIGFPLTGLLLIPAIGLTLGGYLSATSDYQRRARYSIARGALIAPFYAVALGILALFSGSSISGGIEGISAGATASVSALWSVFYGLLWALLFGAFGGWLHYSGRSFLIWATPLMQGLRLRRVAGAIAGAGAAYVCGILLCIALEAALVAYALAASGSSVGSSAVPAGGTLQSTSGGSFLGALELLLIFTLLLAPTIAVWLFALASGATFDVTVPNLGLSSSSSGATQTTSTGLYWSHAPGALPPAAYLLALVPLIAYLVGGRVSARIARARIPGEAFIAGALMAAPLSILMTIVVAMSGFSLDASALGISEGVSYTPSVGGTFLLTLIGGAVVGGLGGMSEVGLPQLGDWPRWLAAPFRVLQPALYPLLDLVSGQPRGYPRSRGRLWFYDGILAAVCLAILALALDALTVALATAAPLSFRSIATVDAVITGLLVGVPLCYFIGALIVAFATPAPTLPIGAPVVPVGVPVSAPAPYMQQPVPVAVGAPGGAVGGYLQPPSMPSMPGMSPVSPTPTPAAPPMYAPQAPYAPQPAQPYQPPAPSAPQPLPQSFTQPPQRTSDPVPPPAAPPA